MNQEIHDILKNIETMMEILLKRDLQPQSENQVSIDEAAALCGLSKKTMYNYFSSGRLNIPSSKTGRVVKFKKTDIIRWNAERTFLSR
jgi:excisionase family DNA binding protein